MSTRRLPWAALALLGLLGGCTGSVETPSAAPPVAGSDLTALQGAASGAHPGEQTPQETRPPSTAPARRRQVTPGRVEAFANHSRSYRVWHAAGCRQRTVVHLDGHPDLDWLPPTQLRRILAAQNDREIASLEWIPYEIDSTARHPLNLTNFLTVAHAAGMIQRVIWVVPDQEPAAMHLAAYRNLLAAHHHLTPDEAQGLQAQGPTITGRLHGLELTVCRFEDLPIPEEPVLLDVDVDYFSTPGGWDERVLTTPRLQPAAVFSQLAERGLRWDLATVSLSVEGGYLPLQLASLGRLTEHALRSYGRPAPSPMPLQAACTAVTQAEQKKPLEALTAAQQLGGDEAARFVRAYVQEQAQALPDPTPGYRAARLTSRFYRRFLLYRGSALRRNGDLVGAVRCFEAFAQQWADPEDRVLGAYLKAQTLERAGQVGAAAQAYEQVVQLRPTLASAVNNLGICYARLGLQPRAERVLRAGLALEGSGCDLNLGRLLLSQGRLTEAKVLAEAARRRDAGSAEACDLLAALARSSGQQEEARRWLEEACKLAPWDPAYVQKLKEL